MAMPRTHVSASFRPLARRDRPLSSRRLVSPFRCRPSHPTARGQLETPSVTPSGPSLFNCRRSAFPTHRDACPFLNSRSQPRRPQTPTRARDAPAAIHLIQRLPPPCSPRRGAAPKCQVTRPLQRSPRLSGQLHNPPRRVRALCSGPVKPPSTLSGPVRASSADALPAPGPTPGLSGAVVMGAFF